jgi:hypothetical protein
MAATYATDYTTATTTTFINRVMLSMISTAIAVSNEASTTPNHAARAAYASKVLANPAGYAAVMAYGVAADGVTDGSVTDAQLDSRLSAIWNSYI